MVTFCIAVVVLDHMFTFCIAFVVWLWHL